MPAASAVSTTPVPFGTWTSRSSILTRTSSVLIGRTSTDERWGGGSSAGEPGGFPTQQSKRGSRRRVTCSQARLVRDRSEMVLVDRRIEAGQGRVGSERAAAVLEVGAKLVAELGHAARDGHRSRVA